MKVNISDYCYPVCPHCKSKKIDHRTLTKVAFNVHRKGFICFNCDRFFDEEIQLIDRAEMRRDIAKLTKFLTEKP